MQRQEGANNREEGTSSWHEKGLLEANKDGPRQQLRKDVVNPEGYRTFATCRHFRLPSQSKPQPATPNTLRPVTRARVTKSS